MIILNLSNVCLSFGTDTILDGISFNIQNGDKVALVGVNGAGKSTLFKVITGSLQNDSGELYNSKGMKIGYLEQNAGLNPENTIWEEVLTTFEELISCEKKLLELEHSISTEKDEEKLSKLMEQYSSLSEYFQRNGGFEYVSRGRGVLKGLGFSEEQFSLKIANLSGGQKTRLSLAKLLLNEPDLLMLDEPTNHLDIEAIEWLESFLVSYNKAVLVISHDRFFLDKVTSRTIEIENTHSYVYECSYSEFVKRKAVNREIQRSHFEQQQREIARLEEFIEQQRRWNRERNIIAAESRQKAIDRMEKIDAPDDLPDKVRMSFHADKKTGNDVLTIEGLSKAYPAKPLFKNIDFKIKKGERVFLLGPNGCGKSTLLKIIQGILPQDDGTVRLGANVEIGYYDQEQTDLDPSSNILDELWKAKEEMTHTEVRNALSAFLFKGEEVFKTISILSGGEKGRVSLAKLMVKGDNFLLLDEPTNHLDINSREVLEQALLEYDGTILAVSHDRYFIDKLATRIIEMTDTGLFDINGNYSYFTEHKRKYREAEEAAASSKPNVTEGKQDYLSTKEDRASKRKQERQLKDTEDRIAAVEARLEAIKNEMLDEKVACDHEKLQELHNEEVRLSQELDGLYELWGNLTE